MEHTLLPDEAMLQTATVNSPFRKTIIAQHLRFIEWPQLHGDANRYWESLGPRFHGGPMVLNVTLAVHKAFLTSAMFARKFDPTVYADVLPEWDKWMAAKLETQAPAPRQPVMGYSQSHNDPQLQAGIPAPTSHEGDVLIDDWKGTQGAQQSPHPADSLHSERVGSIVMADTGLDNAAHYELANDGVHAAGRSHSHDYAHYHEHERDHEHDHEEASALVSGLVLIWVAGVIGAGLLFACVSAARDGNCKAKVHRHLSFAALRSRPEGNKSF